MTAFRLLVVLLATLAVGGCASQGPDADALAREPEFASTLPGAELVEEHAADPRRTVEGSTNAAVSRMWLTDSSADEVVAWYTAALEEAGWRSGVFAYVAMRDGRIPEHSWRRGDLVIAVGFPDPTDPLIEVLDLSLEGRTLYHASITYQPED